MYMIAVFLVIQSAFDSLDDQACMCCHMENVKINSLIYIQADPANSVPPNNP